jgi:hypothetical protein
MGFLLVISHTLDIIAPWFKIDAVRKPAAVPNYTAGAKKPGKARLFYNSFFSSGVMIY